MDNFPSRDTLALSGGRATMPLLTYTPATPPTHTPTLPSMQIPRIGSVDIWEDRPRFTLQEMGPNSDRKQISDKPGDNVAYMNFVLQLREFRALGASGLGAGTIAIVLTEDAVVMGHLRPDLTDEELEETVQWFWRLVRASGMDYRNPVGFIFFHHEQLQSAPLNYTRFKDTFSRGRRPCTLATMTYVRHTTGPYTQIWVDGSIKRKPFIAVQDYVENHRYCPFEPF